MSCAKRFIFLLFAFLLLLSSFSFFAATSVEGDFFITVSTSQFGNVTFLVPANAVDFIHFSSSFPYLSNGYTSTLTLYVVSPSTIYGDTLQWSTYSDITYRTSSSSTRIPLTITSVVDSNLPYFGVDSQDIGFLFSLSKYVDFFILAFSFVVVFLLLFRRSR